MTDTPLRISSPADLLAVVPYVLGFHPEDSLVLLTADRQARQLHARIDLPQVEEEVEEMTTQLRQAVARSGARAVAIVAYTEDQCLALEAVAALTNRLAEDGVDVTVALRADGERWFCLDPPDDDAYPWDGTPYDVSAHPVTAQAVLDGRVTYRSRRDLADSLVGTDPDETEAVGEAADEAMRRFQAAARAAGDDTVREAPRQHLVTEGHWVQARITRYLETGEPLDADEAGRLLVAMVNIEVRDVAWATITRAEARAHVELWRDLVRRTPVDLAAAPAALLGFSAWLAGDGALAWCAVERCQEADPDYNLARLLTRALTAAIDPASWESIPREELTLFGA
jgi:hypothetical protein